MSSIFSALECDPGDLLEFITDSKDEAIAAVVRARGGELDKPTKKTKKGGAK